MALTDLLGFRKLGPQAGEDGGLWGALMFCRHERIELRELQEESMHCTGWACLSCQQLATGECHHQTWCREDFCGSPPLLMEVSGPGLQSA